MKPTIEELEDRSCPATGMSHHAYSGWDVTQIDTWADNAEFLRPAANAGAAGVESDVGNAHVMSFVELRVLDGKLWALPGTHTVTAPLVNGVVVAMLADERFDPVLLAEGVSGASVAHTDTQFVVAYQIGSKVWTVSSVDRLTWSAPALVADLANVAPVAGEAYGLAPLTLDPALNAVVNAGPVVSWVATFPGGAPQYHLVVDVAWQDAGGAVHAAEVADGAMTHLDIDAAFAHPAIFLDLAHAYWGQ